MKFSRILVLMMVGLLLILPGLAEEDAGNLLYNGGFEWTDEDGLPDGWYTDAYVHQEGYTTYRLSDDARSGAACAVVDNLGMNDARFAQSVAVEPESLYRLSGWIRAEGILDSGLGANLSIEGVYVFSESVYDSQGEWTYIELYGEKARGRPALMTCGWKRWMPCPTMLWRNYGLWIARPLSRPKSLWMAVKRRPSGPGFC